MDSLLKRYVFSAKILRVVDGDTIEADLDLGFRVHYVAHLRIAGIDTPEMHDKDAEQRARAKAARKFTEDLAAKYDNKCLVRTYKTKEDTEVKTFDRYVADVVFKSKPEDPDINLAKALADAGFQK